MKEVGTLNDIFVHTLRRVYDAERRLTKALPRLAQSASAPDLKRAFEQHRDETERHVERVEQIFRLFDEQPDADTDEIAKGIVKAGDDIVKLNGNGPARDAALIAAAQEAEHYEIAAYGTLRTWADVLDKPAAVQLLERTLAEEKRADQILTQLAGTLNPQAAAAVR
jgi:ferritin-like metal-binding protein YciE